MQLNYNYSNSAGITVLSLQQHPFTQAKPCTLKTQGNCRQPAAAAVGACREGKLAEMSKGWMGC